MEAAIREQTLSWVLIICPPKIFTTLIDREEHMAFISGTKGCIAAVLFGQLKIQSWGFPGGAVVENLPANAGDTGLSPGLGRSHMPRSN